MSEKQRVVFRNSRLFDGCETPRDGVDVLVEGERIAAIEPSEHPERIAVGAEDRVVDLAGRTLMPGMFSCHFHAVFDGVTPIVAPGTGLHQPPAYMALVAGRNARTALDNGVTSTIGSSTAYGIDAQLKQAIEDGVQPGPRMLAGSSELCTTGDLPTGSMINWHMDLGNLGVVRVADGAVGFQGLVREEIKKGSEVIKVSATKGHGASFTEETMSISIPELESIVRTAHARGALVRAHTVSKVGILECARAGVDLLDHADRLDDECIDLILERDLTVIPSAMYTARTLQIYDAGLMQPFLPDPIPEMFTDVINGARADLENLHEVLPKAVAAGVRFASGDDYGTGYLFHGEYAVEHEYYVKEVGLDPLEVLRWATKNGAEAMRRADDLGTIEVGKLADLVVVDGDPVADITCLQDTNRLLAIIQGGAFYKDAFAG